MQNLYMKIVNMQPSLSVRLESFKSQMDSRIIIYEDKVKMVMDYLVRYCKTKNVDVRECWKLCTCL